MEQRQREYKEGWREGHRGGRRYLNEGRGACCERVGEGGGGGGLGSACWNFLGRV